LKVEFQDPEKPTLANSVGFKMCALPFLELEKAHDANTPWGHDESEPLFKK
jgi:hypothetical protein